LAELTQIIEVFNNRELALITWSVFLFLVSSLNKAIRNSYINIVKIFAIRIVAITTLSFFAYVGFITYLFYSIGFWETEFLKNTILWTLFVGLILVWKFANSQEVQKLFNKVLINSFSVIIILEFIIDIYVYSFWHELLIVGIVSFLVIIEAVFSTNEEFKSAQIIVEKILSIIGLIILFIALYYALTDLADLFTLTTFKSLIYPIILTIFSFLFFYLFVLILKYESTFNRLKSSSADSSLKRKAKFMIFKHCLLSFKKIKKANNMSIYNLYKLSEEKDIKEMESVYEGFAKPPEFVCF